MVSGLEFGRKSVEPTWHDEAELAMVLTRLLGGQMSGVYWLASVTMVKIALIRTKERNIDR